MESRIKEKFENLLRHKPTGLYPSETLILKVQSLFLEVIDDNTPLPSIQPIPDDNAIIAFWGEKGLVCCFYDDEEDLKAYYSFRGLDSTVCVKKGDLDNHCLAEELKAFISS
jgi:hypothetical protein